MKTIKVLAIAIIAGMTMVSCCNKCQKTEECAEEAQVTACCGDSVKECCAEHTCCKGAGEAACCAAEGETHCCADHAEEAAEEVAE